MIPPRPIGWLVAALLCISHAFSATLDSLPPADELAGQSELRAGDSSHFELQRDGVGRRGDDAVWRVRTRASATDPWLAQLKVDLRAPAKRGDSGLLVIAARAIETSHESDQARFRLVVADKLKAFPRVVVGEFSADREWREFAVPFTFNRDYPVGEIAASIDLGYGRQTIELAGFRVLNFGSAIPIDRLPRTRATYVGHEPGAAWRREAHERIEKIRKDDLSLLVTDSAGRPVDGAQVRAVLAAHAFEFGTAVNVEAFTQKSPDAEAYRHHIETLFNAASLENGLKWGNWLGEGKAEDYRERTFHTLQWLQERQLPLRGHVMVWPGWRFLPNKIKSLRDTPDQERIPQLALEHIRDVAVATKDYIGEWDVLNEPVSNHDLMDLFGREIVLDWYKEAGRLLPGVPLFLNDWGNHDIRSNPDHVRQFEAWAQYLRDNDAPIHGLGLQGHIGGVLSPPQNILATLDHYQKTLGLPVRITEFDVTTDDEDIQADYTRDFLTAMFSHPSVIGVQFWGFWEGRHWQPKAALYRKDWTEKPNGAAYRELVKKTWHTDAVGETDAAGRWTTRAFHGRYDIVVTIGDKTHHATIQHAPSATEPLRVTLPAGY